MYDIDTDRLINDPDAFLAWVIELIQAGLTTEAEIIERLKPAVADDVMAEFEAITESAFNTKEGE